MMMVASVNKVTLLGILGRDPEVRTFSNGNRVVTFSLATDESWKDKRTGERKSKTEWHSIVIHNEKIGEIAEQYIKKGSRIYLEGKIESRRWTPQDGAERTVTEIVIPRFGGELRIISSPSDRQTAFSGGSKADDMQPVEFDDDIPF